MSLKLLVPGLVAIVLNVVPSVPRWMTKPVSLLALSVQVRLIWLVDGDASQVRLDGAAGNDGTTVYSRPCGTTSRGWLGLGPFEPRRRVAAVLVKLHPDLVERAGRQVDRSGPRRRALVTNRLDQRRGQVVDPQPHAVVGRRVERVGLGEARQDEAGPADRKRVVPMPVTARRSPQLKLIVGSVRVVVRAGEVDVAPVLPVRPLPVSVSTELTVTVTLLIAVCPPASRMATKRLYVPLAVNVATVFFAALVPLALKPTGAGGLPCTPQV